MDDTTTATAAAATAAEAVRALNHLTMAPPAPDTPGWEDLHDVYAVIGELRLLGRRLPQALGQVAAVLERPASGVGFGTDNDADPVDVVADAVDTLAAARSSADALQRHLEAAHDAVSHLYVARELIVVDGEAGE